MSGRDSLSDAAHTPAHGTHTSPCQRPCCVRVRANCRELFSYGHHSYAHVHLRCYRKDHAAVCCGKTRHDTYTVRHGDKKEKEGAAGAEERS